jgi:phosphoglycolate phosphatase
MQKPDSIIFDMDGTLWDAVDTYAYSWNKVFEQQGIDKTVTRDTLAEMVGWEGKKVVQALMPEFDDEKRQSIYATVTETRHTIIPEKGGVLYPGVKEGLAELSKHYPLFILSNCAKGIIRLFIDWAGIDEYITDELAYGVNYMSKHHNMQLLMDKHGLKTPVYVGDTDGDSQQSAMAGVPFVLVTYGFGSSDNYALKFDNFTSLTAYFTALK